MERGDSMPASKAQQKAVNKYMKANYDEIKVRVEKGKKDIVQSYASARGESVNGFIGRAITETMERDGCGPAAPSSTQDAAGAPGSSVGIQVSHDTLEVVQRAAEATGETVTEFVTRAVETTEQLDKGSLSLGISPVEAWKKENETRRRRADFISSLQKASETK